MPGNNIKTLKEAYTAGLPTPVPATPVAAPVPGKAPSQAELRAALRAAIKASLKWEDLCMIVTRLVQECKLGQIGHMRLLVEVLKGDPKEPEESDSKKQMLTPEQVEEALKEAGFERVRR